MISSITLTTDGSGIWHYRLMQRVATDGHETTLYRSREGSGLLVLIMEEARMLAEACDKYGPVTVPVQKKAG